MFDPNAPAFGPNSQKPEDLQTPKVEEKKDAEPGEEAVAESTEDKELETSDQESAVPYKRFKKFHDQAKEFQAEAEKLRAEAEEWKRKASATEPAKTEEPSIPDYWKKLYGDSEESIEAWKIQEQANKSLIEQTRKEALEAIKEQSRLEAEREKQNVEKLESSLEALNDYAGKELSKSEQSAVLDIVEEYSSKDDDGNFTSMIPFEKAYDIFNLKQQADKAPKVQSRNKVASINNAKTQGSPSDDQAERNKNFNPLDWGAALRRIKE